MAKLKFPPPLPWQIKAAALLSGAAVFALPYVAVGFAYAPYRWDVMLEWPLWVMLDATVILLIALMAVAAFAAWLTMRALKAEWAYRSAVPYLNGRIDMLLTEVDRAYQKGKREGREEGAGPAGSTVKAAEGERPDDRGKFQRARQSFARLYHPDNVGGGGIERMIRQEVFKEFWQELERIDKE